MDLPFLTKRHINSSSPNVSFFNENSPKPKPNYLLTNPLSVKWKVSVLEYTKNEHPWQLAALPLYYVTGMLGYLVSIPVRVAGFGKDVVMLGVTILAPCYGGGGYLSRIGVRFKVLGGSAADILIAGVGVFIPPLAYFFDEKLQSHTNIHAHSFTQWSYDALQGAGITTTSKINLEKVVQIALRFVSQYIDNLADYMEETEVFFSVVVLFGAGMCVDSALNAYEGDKDIAALRAQIKSYINQDAGHLPVDQKVLQHLALFVLQAKEIQKKDEEKFQIALENAKQELLVYDKELESLESKTTKLVLEAVKKGNAIFVVDLQKKNNKAKFWASNLPCKTKA